MAQYGTSKYGSSTYGSSPDAGQTSSQVFPVPSFVMPGDIIARGLGFKGDLYKYPEILDFGLGKYMAQQLAPDDYWEDPFWNRLQMALGGELENIARWLQIIPADIVQRILDDDWYNEIDGMVAQFFPQTASGNALGWWENLLGLPSDESQPNYLRRSIVINQLQNRGQSPTVQYMLGIVKKYVNDAVIIDQNALPTGTHDNSFVIRIIDPVGVPATDALMRADIDRFKPATLAYTIQYTEPDWAGMADKDWATIGETDWANLT